MSNSLALTPTPIASATGSSAFPIHVKRVFPSDQSVPQLISHQARENPGHIALDGSSMRLTYGELDYRANQLARRLKELGVAANTAVAVCVRRSPLAALASLAVMKAGAAYLPIDSNYPRERPSFILSDSCAPIVLSQSHLARKLPEGNLQLLLLDGEDLAGRTPAALEANEVCPDHLAYVIYTSGSTGTPKGVEITHANLLNLVCWYQKAFVVTPDDRATQLTSFGFDAAVAELWPHLAAGASLLFTPEEVRSSPELLRDWFIDQEITIAFVPTALAERLITLDWPIITRLRLLLTGADTLHHYPRPGLPFALIRSYGPTETTVMATS